MRSLDDEPIFAAYPVALDVLGIDLYMKRFIGRQLFEELLVSDRRFRHPAPCIMSIVARRTDRDGVNAKSIATAVEDKLALASDLAESGVRSAISDTVDVKNVRPLFLG